MRTDLDPLELMRQLCRPTLSNLEAHRKAAAARQADRPPPAPRPAPRLYDPRKVRQLG